jgi:hypothetical protein
LRKMKSIVGTVPPAPYLGLDILMCTRDLQVPPLLGVAF